jgi:hypothetical protein
MMNNWNIDPPRVTPGNKPESNVVLNKDNERNWVE